MKNIYKSIALLVVIISALSGCETTDLDGKTDDPNALAPNQASTDLFLNAIQRDAGFLIAELEVEAAEAARMKNMDGRQYRNAFEPSRFDVQWTNAYQVILNDIKTMKPIAQDAGQVYHVGVAQILEAYVLVTLVDLFGDIPYTEALQGSENLNPAIDDGQAVYLAAEALLDSAITNLSVPDEEVPSQPATDLYYGGDWDNWVKAANSLKMKMFVTGRLVTDRSADFDAIVASGDFIDEESEDFQFEWGTSFNNPDARHPEYVTNYTPAGANSYMSNWMMGYMLLGKVGNSVSVFEEADPRMKYYFYRQTNQVRFDNPNLLDCAQTDPPPHYAAEGASNAAFPVYCGLPVGYWGRDHGDDAGIPPDGQLRTAYGLYPVGGRFDDNSFQVIASISLGAGGAGITPFILSSYTDFYQAEMAMADGQTAEAQTFLTNGVAKSFAKVRAFGDRDPNADMSTAPDPALDVDYVIELGQLFAAANDQGKWDLLGAEFLVTAWGNGVEGFNFYRRTGAPSDIQANIEPAPGEYFRSLFYPPRFVERNSNVTQKDGVSDPVWWDNGSATTR